jgi:hypothetical protein
MPLSYLEAIRNGASTNNVRVMYDEKIRQLEELVKQGKRTEKELRQLEAARLDEERAEKERLLLEAASLDEDRAELERLVYERGKQAEENLRQREAARLEEELIQRRIREEDARQYIQREQEEYDNMTPEQRRMHHEEKQLWLESKAKIHMEIDKERVAHERRRRCYPHLNLRPYDDPYDSEDDLVLDDETAKRPMSPMTEDFYNLIGDTLYAMDLESERRG